MSLVTTVSIQRLSILTFCTRESLGVSAVDWAYNVLIWCLVTSKASGGECNPSADVCSHSASTDRETGKLRINARYWLVSLGKKSPIPAQSWNVLLIHMYSEGIFFFHEVLLCFQVVPKPLNPTSQIVTTSQPQQRLIMPATPLPQIQPNLTNLPPGTVLAPAPGTGNVGYAVLPAQYVTQVWS